MHAILEVVSPAATIVEALQALRSDPSHAAVLLDIDGTLAPIVRHADDAHVPQATRMLLIEIAKRYGLVGCISGRRAQAARQMVSIGSIAYVGNHGAELLRPGSTSVQVNPEAAAWAQRVRDFANTVYDRELLRLRVRYEDKQLLAAFHWRGAPDEQAAELAVGEIASRAQQQGLAVHWGRKVLEVRPPVELHKGLGIAALLGASSPERSPPGPIHTALYVGDDVTDIDAFGALRGMVHAGRLQSAVCVASTSEEAPAELIRQADLTVEGTAGVKQLLEALL